MKKILILTLCVIALQLTQAQTSDKSGVEQACMNYIEGFYEGNVSKLEASLQPTLNKFGFWKDKDTNTYRQVPHMSYDQAMAYAKNVLEKKEFPKPDAPRDVLVLDISKNIASAKVTAWWGIDYILLSKRGDKWMIEQVLWEGPLEN
ncbi:nuclear transport factor 2 family protein [Lacinutrix iliipiscaria]|uniref:Nuclear transport factor 2 family protein n=1 Tax=Lacinutrix iliipiscaria TaxID=1230532 RepID=A0ABW5WP76_9FLAO